MSLVPFLKKVFPSGHDCIVAQWTYFRERKLSDLSQEEFYLFISLNVDSASHNRMLGILYMMNIDQNCLLQPERLGPACLKKTIFHRWFSVLDLCKEEVIGRFYINGNLYCGLSKINIKIKSLAVMLCPVSQISPSDIGPMAFCRKRHRLWDSQAWMRCLNTTLSNLKSVYLVAGRACGGWVCTAYSCGVSASSGTHRESSSLSQ